MDLIVNFQAFTFILGHGQNRIVLLSARDIDLDMSHSPASSAFFSLTTYSTVEYFGFSACHNRELSPGWESIPWH